MQPDSSALSNEGKTDAAKRQDITPPPGLRGRVQRLVESQWFQFGIMGVILVNAVALGLETSGVVMGAVGPLLMIVDVASLTIFVIEIALKLFAYRLAFFRQAWNIFDFLIVAVTLMPFLGQSVSVLRALRILRAFRLMSMVPKMRVVVQALVVAIPGMSSILALLSLVFYVFAVMATKLFGEAFPEWFGTIGSSLYTLFQVMTLESWSMGIVRPVMDVFPLAWLYFIPFILLTTFAVLNLFIAVVVDAMQEMHRVEDEQKTGTEEVSLESRSSDEAHSTALILSELRELRAEVADLRAQKSG
ncbi:MAG: ion transporter [Pseudomonadota bacterium]